MGVGLGWGLLLGGVLALSSRVGCSEGWLQPAPTLNMLCCRWEWCTGSKGWRACFRQAWSPTEAVHGRAPSAPLLPHSRFGPDTAALRHCTLQLNPDLWSECLQQYGVLRKSAICGTYITI